MKIKLAFPSSHWAIFSQILNVSLLYKEMEIHQHNAGHMTCLYMYMVKTLYNLLSRTHWADFGETLYEASETFIRDLHHENMSV